MSSQEDINPDSSPDSPTGTKNSKDAMFEPKAKPKMIRVLTVLAYVLSVSMTAILLSIYYIFMWEGRPHLGSRKMEIEFGGDLSLSQPSASHHYQIIPEDHFSLHIPYSAKEVTANVEKTSLQSLRNESAVFNFTTLYNGTQEESYPGNKTEMQQQFTAMESEEVQLSPTVTTTEDSVTWFDDYDTRENKSLEDFKKSSVLIRKLIDKYDTNY